MLPDQVVEHGQDGNRATYVACTAHQRFSVREDPEQDLGDLVAVAMRAPVQGEPPRNLPIASAAGDTRPAGRPSPGNR
ncbi:MAG TPA: hypothetical protein VI320_13970 [Terracidiphilus sp.]